MDIKKIENLLSQVKDDFHVSFDFMLAMIEGKIDAQDRQSLERHIDHCPICKDTYQAIQKEVGLLLEGKSVLKEEGKPLDLRLMKKLRLVAEIHPKRDLLAEKIAQIFLSKVTWLSIRPVIAIFREWLRGERTADQSNETDNYAVAAFAGGSADDNEDNETIVNSVKAADYICDQVIERCQEQGQIDEIMDMTVENAIILFGDDQDTSKNRQQLKETIHNVLQT